MITEEEYLKAQETIKLYKEQLRQQNLKRTYSYGDVVRAKSSSPARALGDGKCIYVSAMSNELCLSEIDMEADWENKYNLPLPGDEDLQRLKTCKG